jgi:two-component system chemotaxis sensor kinase CheA
VIISISDDGRGLDPQMILEKAVKKGLIQAGIKMKEEDIINLIFLPGFSTRDQVTEISGRGVGMDIVQKAIDYLGGRIETTSRKGHGTTFQITLPASLEIIEGLMVRVTDQTIIVPRQDIIEIVDLDEHGIENVGEGGRAIRIREQVIPVEDLADYVGTKTVISRATDPAPLNSDARRIGLLIRLPDRTRLALRVEAVLSQQQIVVRPLNDQLSKVPGFTGVTILGNGEPAMILSTAAIGENYLKWIRRKATAGTKKYGESA